MRFHGGSAAILNRGSSAGQPRSGLARIAALDRIAALARLRTFRVGVPATMFL